MYISLYGFAIAANHVLKSAKAAIAHQMKARMHAAGADLVHEDRGN
jgi:hypothetical protein